MVLTNAHAHAKRHQLVQEVSGLQSRRPVFPIIVHASLLSMRWLLTALTNDDGSQKEHANLS